MSIFRKRTSLTENITYMALMASINVVFVLISTLVPVLLFLLVFLLPLTSAIVTVFCKKRYYPIYAIVTVSLCMIVTMWNIGDTFYYVIPSLFTGFLFGVLFSKKISVSSLILLTTFVQVLLSYGCIFIFEILTERNFLNDMTSIIGLSNYLYLSYIKSIFLFGISLIQTIFSFAVINEELPKFGEDYVDNPKEGLINGISIIALSALTLTFAFFYGELSYLFMLSSLLIGINEFVSIMAGKNTRLIIATIVTTIVAFFVFSITYSSIEAPKGLLMIGIVPLSNSIIVLVNYFIKQRNKVIIK